MALHGRFPSGEISFYPCASSARSCRSCGCGPLPVRRSRVASRSDYTRGQSQETGSLSKLFGSMETTAKCVSVGPAHCRERLQNPVRFSSTSIQQGGSHSGGPRADSGNGTRSKYSLKEGGHRGGSSSQKRVRVLQPVLHSFEEVWMVVSHFRSASVEPLISRLNFKMLTLKQVVSQTRSSSSLSFNFLTKPALNCPSFRKQRSKMICADIN